MILVWRCILRTLCVVMYHILLIAYGHGIHAKVCGSMTAVFMFSSSGLYCPIRRSPIPAILMISTRSPFGVPWHHLLHESFLARGRQGPTRTERCPFCSGSFLHS